MHLNKFDKEYNYLKFIINYNILLYIANNNSGGFITWEN